MKFYIFFLLTASATTTTRVLYTYTVLYQRVKSHTAGLRALFWMAPPKEGGYVRGKWDWICGLGEYVRGNDGKWNCVSGPGGYVRGNDGKWHWVCGQGKYVRGNDGKWHWNPCRNAVNPRH